MHVYKFRDCLLNTAERSVIKEHQHLDLTTKTFDVLQYLIENAGKVVSKDEILGNVWNGNFVEESNLPVHISKLRRSLSESRDCRFIETVQGTGYRFVAPLRTASENEWQAATNRTAILPESFSAQPAEHSIAVLPFQNESSDTNLEYLTDGLTESLINGLTQIANLRVIARNTVFRYKDKFVRLEHFGQTLGVSHVLTGRLRLSENQMTVSVELIRAVDGAQVWGEQYRCVLPELQDVQAEIMFAVVENLTLTKLREKRLAANSLTRHPESYRLYLKGRHILEKHSAADIAVAIDFFRKSTLLDPENIYSHVEIVECYRSLHAFGYISYKQFLEISKPVLDAISKGNQSIDVVQVLYCDLEMLEWRFDRASIYCKRALALNPNSLKGRLRYSDLLLQSRKFKSALEQLERLMVIDPLSPLIYKRIGRLFYMMGEDESAVAFLNDALDLEPGCYEALALRGATYTEMAAFDRALNDFEESYRAQPHPETVALKLAVYAKKGDHAVARKLLKGLESHATVGAGHATTLAYANLTLGNKDDALALLEKAYIQHEPDLRALTYDRRWLALRSDSRFRALSKRIGLPNLKD